MPLRNGYHGDDGRNAGDNRAVGYNESRSETGSRLGRASISKAKITASKCRQTAVDQAAIKDMERQLSDAAMTLARMPNDVRTRPASLRSAWPEMQRGCRFTYGATRLTSRHRPTPAQIDQLDQMIQLLWHLSPSARRLVWARACRIPWALLVARMGRSRTSLNRDFRNSLMVLVRLCRDG